MRIHATFVNFRHDPEVIELVHAWDEYCLDSNPTGYEDTKREELARYGDDVLNTVTVDIVVSHDAIVAALNPRVEIQGDIA